MPCFDPQASVSEAMAASHYGVCGGGLGGRDPDAAPGPPGLQAGGKLAFAPVFFTTRSSVSAPAGSPSGSGMPGGTTPLTNGAAKRITDLPVWGGHSYVKRGVSWICLCQLVGRTASSMAGGEKYDREDATGAVAAPLVVRGLVWPAARDMRRSRGTGGDAYGRDRDGGSIRSAVESEGLRAPHPPRPRRCVLLVRRQRPSHPNHSVRAAVGECLSAPNSPGASGRSCRIGSRRDAARVSPCRAAQGSGAQAMRPAADQPDRLRIESRSGGGDRGPRAGLAARRVARRDAAGVGRRRERIFTRVREPTR